MERRLRPWEDPDDPTAGFLEYDVRPSWEKLDPVLGVSAWDALYHFVDPVAAASLFELDLMGYGDESNIDPKWWPEERNEFDCKHASWRFGVVNLKGRLLGKLLHGELTARGFSNLAPLDAPRRPVNPERWRDLELDVKASSASGPGIEITQILISAEVGPLTTTPSSTYSPAALRRWYVSRIAKFEAEGRSSSREDDVRDANAELGRVPRRKVESLRRELAPARWTQRGRPPSRRG